MTTETGSQRLIRQLNMKPLKGESGFISLLATSNIDVKRCDRTFKANSSIYYMLNREKPVNYLHWLSMDDMHVLSEGGPVDYYVFSLDGNVQHHVLGRDLDNGQKLAVMIPGGCYKALKLHKESEYALMISILTPEWTKEPGRLQIGADNDFLDKYSCRAKWATREFLKDLIGPNFRED